MDKQPSKVYFLFLSLALHLTNTACGCEESLGSFFVTGLLQAYG